MRLALLAVSTIGAGLLAAVSAQAADMVPPQPPPAYAPPPAAYAPPPVVVEPAPVFAEPVGPAGCWRYGAFGWGWYPCGAGPRAYWHGYRHGYRERPYWARAYHGHRSYW
jgi:hypothetical protein